MLLPPRHSRGRARVCTLVLLSSTQQHYSHTVFRLASGVVGASVSKPPLVDSTATLSRYIHVLMRDEKERRKANKVYIDREIDVCPTFWPPGGPALCANVARRIGNQISPAECAFSACIGLGLSQSSYYDD